MKRALVIGDDIEDEYIFGTATRLCPEGPVPVIIPQKTETRAGGARLVADQLAAIVGSTVLFLKGSQSKKKRIFADNRLICRLDEDSYWIDDTEKFTERVIHHAADHDLLIISDYGKGSLTRESAEKIQDQVKAPILVDAKNNFDWYSRAFAMFPNEREIPKILSFGQTPNLIRKLGPRGCSVNEQIVPLDREHPVRDVTGAGDCFLAAFAAEMLDQLDYKTPDRIDLISCARFANKVAARSVEFVGTHVVTDIKL